MIADNDDILIIYVLSESSKIMHFRQSCIFNMHKKHTKNVDKKYEITIFINYYYDMFLL